MPQYKKLFKSIIYIKLKYYNFIICKETHKNQPLYGIRRSDFFTDNEQKCT